MCEWDRTLQACEKLMNEGRKAVRIAANEGLSRRTWEPMLSFTQYNDGSWAYQFKSYCLDVPSGGDQQFSTLREMAGYIENLADEAERQNRLYSETLQ